MFISPMLLCLSFLISTTVQAKIDCRTYPSKVDVKLADCLAALNLIPDGGLAPGPPIDGVPSFLLPSSARSAPRRFRIPAYFWSDTCKISVVEPPLVIKIPKPTPTRAMPNPASVRICTSKCGRKCEKERKPSWINASIPVAQGLPLDERLLQSRRRLPYWSRPSTPNRDIRALGWAARPEHAAARDCVTGQLCSLQS